MTDEEVAEHANRAYELATAANSPEVLSEPSMPRAGFCSGSTTPRRPLPCSQHSSRLRSPTTCPGGADGTGNLADVRTQSDLPGAESEHLAALELAERLGDVGNRAVCFNNLAFHYFYGPVGSDGELRRARTGVHRNHGPAELRALSPAHVGGHPRGPTLHGPISR